MIDEAWTSQLISWRSPWLPGNGCCTHPGFGINNSSRALKCILQERIFFLEEAKHNFFLLVEFDELSSQLIQSGLKWRLARLWTNKVGKFGVRINIAYKDCFKRSRGLLSPYTDGTWKLFTTRERKYLVPEENPALLVKTPHYYSKTALGMHTANISESQKRSNI